MPLLDFIALGIFCFCWVGFSYLVKYISGTNKACLTKTLEYFRDTWMSEMLKEQDRVADIQTLGMFERNCNFFASSSLLIVAGLLTFLGSLDKAELIAQKFGGLYIEHISYKVIALLILFISSFFAFTWSMRQFGFAGFMVVGAPYAKRKSYTKDQRKKFAQNTSTVIDLAAFSFQRGLYTYYYSLALLSWFAGPWFLIGSTLLVTLVLYRREFHSKTMLMLQKAHQDLTETILLDETSSGAEADVKK